MSIVRQIDMKHHIDENGNIVKTGNGVVVPLDEPLIMFRGRDYLALPLLIKYQEMCERDGCNDFQLGQIQALIDKFAEFASKNPGVMKQPGVTRGL